MINSMTGYGRSEHESTLQKVVIEMKAVNHRYCDVVIKMPKKLTMFEEKRGEDYIDPPNYAVLDQ